MMKDCDNIYFQIYAWPLLETLFSEVLTREEWMMLFDNVFSNHPSFLLMVVAAYAMCARGPLMQCVELDDFRVSCAKVSVIDFLGLFCNKFGLTGLEGCLYVLI
jgi:hypothetical protein